jgi:antitoxin ParD1/3/4
MFVALCVVRDMLADMHVSLTPDIQRFVEEQVKAGRFSSVEDAVNGLIGIAKQEEELTEQDVEELRAEIDVALKEVEAGQVGEWDAADLKRRVRDHLGSEKRAG